MKKSTIFIIIIGIFISSSILVFSMNDRTSYISPYYFGSGNELIDVINLSEEMTVNLSPNIVDIDETITSFEFGYPFEEDGYWDIDYDSSGFYISNLVVDTIDKPYRYFFGVNVENVNRPPEVSVSDIIAEENETLYVDYDAYDPDGRELNITFDAPFDENGVWETEIGDAGNYVSAIHVSDGIDTVTKEFDVFLEEKPLPPEVLYDEIQYAKQGENFTLDYEIVSDRDYSIDISGCMESNKTYFDYDSPKQCRVSIEVSDDYFDISRDIIIEIEEVNRPPVIEEVQLESDNMTFIIEENNEYDLYEGQNIIFHVDAYDPDGDDISYSFYPFSERFELGYDDSGIYDARVEVTDGVDNVSKSFTLNVINVNRPPVIEIEDEHQTKEGENFSLEPNVYDPDGDDVEVSYSGWMNESMRYVDFGEHGNHSVIISAFDGEDVTEKEILVEVERVFREPEIRGITVEIIN